MKEQKTLAQLGFEYEQAAEKVSARIRAARSRLKLLKNDKCGREAYRLKSELSVLYRERRDALETAKTLREYYSAPEAADEREAAA